MNVLLINKAVLAGCNACEAGIEWFDRHFGDNSIDCQSLINECLEANEHGYALWLYKCFGSAYRNVVICKPHLICDNTVLALGNLHVAGNVSCGDNLYVSGALVVNGNLRAKRVECDSFCGNSINASAFKATAEVTAASVTVEDRFNAGSSVNIKGDLAASTVAVSSLYVRDNLTAQRVVADCGIIVGKDANISTLLHAGFNIEVRGKINNMGSAPPKIIAGTRVVDQGQVMVGIYKGDESAANQ